MKKTGKKTLQGANSCKFAKRYLKIKVLVKCNAVNLILGTDVCIKG